MGGMTSALNGQPEAERRGGSEHVFASTTWEWKKAKIRRPAGGQQHSAPKGRRFFHLPQRDWRRPTTLTIKYRGGPEGWVEIHARGSIARYPGYVCILDILKEITRN